jgi:hypothetical protein
MLKEIEILLRAQTKGCLIVGKESHLLLEGEELLAAQRDGLYQKESDLLPPQRQIELSGPFPGCMHFGGAAGRNQYRSVGETEHCVIFYPAEESGCTNENILNHCRQSGGEKGGLDTINTDNAEVLGSYFLDGADG